ncbi:hypothetical protein [Flexivirga sp. B27]
MTIAVSLKVHDGVVLAADSASTLMARDHSGNVGVVNVYDNANKIVNLVKGLPLGVMTWGSGSIGPVSMTTIFKDLRAMLSGDVAGPDGQDWALDRAAFTVEAVAERVKEYVVDRLYVEEFGSGAADSPELGMVVAGYSTGGAHAEEWKIEAGGSAPAAPIEGLRPGAECGFMVGGQPATVMRLVMGVDPRMPEVLQDALGVPPEQCEPAAAVLQQHLQQPVVQDAMPFKDALDLAEFLVETTVKMTRFLPGPATVGGPIEVAGISKHEGFKWVARKHYFNTELNPQESK